MNKEINAEEILQTRELILQKLALKKREGCVKLNLWCLSAGEN